MRHSLDLSRRTFLALAAAAPLGLAAPGKRSIPIGLELYSVRDALKKDPSGTLDGVAGMGYQCVEFYAAYMDWTADQARTVRKQLDRLGIRCSSTHNALPSFSGDGMAKAIELNRILGSSYIVLAHAGEVTGLDGWKKIAVRLNQGEDAFSAQGMHAGYHNHDVEWKPIDGQTPMELLAANTAPRVMLQLDVGTCLEAGGDPVAWINKNPGRIRSLHCKDWSAARGYRVLFGEGSAPWKDIFQAAEKTGGVEYYLIEQEGSDYSEMRTAELCMDNWRKLRA